MNIIDLVGILGAALALLAFLLIQSDKVTQKSFFYDLLNAIAGVLLVIYGYHYNTWPFVILNIVWAGASIKDLIFTKYNN
ncbi:hypothetical protein KC678_02310 [Candidatus Dojkabacteria bacterium]|uniref:CBU-0592-like domain-containing protein n=1 Tax=Candidatus Dojkabacteria bacterium TaxID=2099670 RepID=A0A955IBA4_9BACT|nr:hypothetical protein [Candidatus Dojkabacteria bacterium]